jgi:hypothetical protein
MTSSITSPSMMPSCSTNSVGDIPINTGPWCGIAAQIGSNNETLNATRAMEACCRDAPIISLGGSCDIYCNALNQTTDELMNCLGQNFGANKGNTAGILCSRKGSNDGSKKVTPPRLAKVMGLAVVLWGIASFLDSGL